MISDRTWAKLKTKNSETEFDIFFCVVLIPLINISVIYFCSFFSFIIINQNGKKGKRTPWQTAESYLLIRQSSVLMWRMAQMLQHRLWALKLCCEQITVAHFCVITWLCLCRSQVKFYVKTGGKKNVNFDCNICAKALWFCFTLLSKKERILRNKKKISSWSIQ